MVLCALLLPQVLTNLPSAKASVHRYISYFYPILLYYLYLLISFIVVYRLGPDNNHLETRVGMIALPLLLSFLTHKSRSQVKLICYTYILVISGLSVHGIFLYVQYLTTAGEVTAYILNTDILVMHRPVWGLYILGALATIHYLYTEFKVSSRSKNLLALLAVPNLIFLVMAQPKSSILALLVVLSFGIFYHSVYKKRDIKVAFMALLVLVLSVLLVILAVYLLNERYFYYFSESMHISLEYRLSHWYCAIDSIKKGVIFGVGTGIDNFVMDECYKAINKEELLGFSTHSQYLNTLLESGLIGLSMVLWWLWLIFYKGLKRQQEPVMYWIIMIAVAMLTEDVFSAQKPILILFSILCLLLFTDRREPLVKVNE